jgi:hypothetical protein
MLRTALVFFAAPILLATACAPTTEQLQALSAGSIGCPQDEISIANRQEVNNAVSSWQADCRGHSFVCGISGRSEIACAPMLAPVASAPTAPPPPPPPPEDPRTACAEAGEYDRRAAAATSPGKEQLQRIADHKHRDCAAGQGDAGQGAAPRISPVAPPAQ